MLHRALRLLRTYHQMSQTDLAKRLGISSSYLSEIEKGETKVASLDLLNRYSETFKMPVSSILLFSEQVEQGTRSGAKLRIASAEKIIRLLEWIEGQQDVHAQA